LFAPRPPPPLPPLPPPRPPPLPASPPSRDPPLLPAPAAGKARKELEKLEKKGKAVGAPLPKTVSDRLERTVAYDKSKTQLNEWQSTVKANREAPTLDFRDARSQGSLNQTTTTGALAAGFKPSAAGMEAEVAELLLKAGAHNTKAVEEAEEALALKALTVADAKDRRDRLVRMRNLMFYHEEKAKRLKKIKSKGESPSEVLSALGGASLRSGRPARARFDIPPPPRESRIGAARGLRWPGRPSTLTTRPRCPPTALQTTTSGSRRRRRCGR